MMPSPTPSPPPPAPPHASRSVGVFAFALTLACTFCASGCGGLVIGAPAPAPAAAWMAERGDDLWLGLAPDEARRPQPRVARAADRRSRPLRVPRPRAVARAGAADTERDAATPPPAAAARTRARANTHAQPGPTAPSAEAPDLEARQRVAAAQRLLDRRGNADRPFVDEVLHAAGQGVAVDGRAVYAAALHRALADRGALLPVERALPGDIVFFRDTLDVNGNRRPDDGVTLAAVVERVESNRLVVIARRGGRVRRLGMQPSRPDDVRDGAGAVINTRLVRWPGEAAARTTGACFAAIGRP